MLVLRMQPHLRTVFSILNKRTMQNAYAFRLIICIRFYIIVNIIIENIVKLLVHIFIKRKCFEYAENICFNTGL